MLMFFSSGGDGSSDVPVPGTSGCKPYTSPKKVRPHGKSL